MTSDTSSFETPEQDDLGYRDTHLGVAGIFINEYTVEQLPVGLRRMILDMTRYDGNIPEDSETAAIVRDTPQAFRLAPPDDAGAREKYDLARQIRIGARDLEETGGTSCADKVFGAFKDDTSVFSTMSNTRWTAPIHPYPRAQHLIRPRPTLAVGFRLIPRFYGQPVTTFSHVFYERLACDARLRWNDKVSPALAFNLVYPFLLLEARPATQSAYVAANHLAHGLAFSIGTLRNLRANALPQSTVPTEALIAFGVATSGTDWTIYLAHELQPGNPIGDIHLCRIWGGDPTVPLEAVVLLQILDRIRDWSIHTLRSSVDGWLQALLQ